jgi:hypothetical protein
MRVLRRPAGFAGLGALNLQHGKSGPESALASWRYAMTTPARLSGLVRRLAIGSGGGSGYKTDVWVNDDGSRVAVLLLNARHYDTAQPAADQAAHDTLARLYCGA